MSLPSSPVATTGGIRLPRHQHPLLDILLLPTTRNQSESFSWRSLARCWQLDADYRKGRTYGELDILFNERVSARKFRTTSVAEFEDTTAPKGHTGGEDKVADKPETEHRELQ